MSRDEKTQRVAPEEDRTVYLREALASTTTVDDLIPLIREVARVMISMNKDVTRIPELSNSIISLQRLFMNFMEDHLKVQERRELNELEAAKLKVSYAEEGLNRTSQKMKAIQMTGKTGVPLLTKAPFSWSEWFRDKCLPYLVNFFIFGTISLLGIALWQYFKSQIGIP